jgi:hypothetical protein
MLDKNFAHLCLLERLVWITEISKINFITKSLRNEKDCWDNGELFAPPEFDMLLARDVTGFRCSRKCSWFPKLIFFRW